MARRVTAEQFSRIVSGKMQAIVQRGREIVRENGEYGAELVRDVVETSGTAKSGKRGRIETGAMLAGVDSQYKDLADGGEARYGFLNPMPYTKFQEFGFDHLGGAHVEGMFAVDDAHSNIEVDFRRDISRMMKEEWG